MSGTLQSAPTATQTVASGGAGVFPVGTGYYPAEGSRCVTVQYNWTSQTGYTEDLSQLVARGVETSIQSVYIDNSAVAVTVTMTVAGTGQVIVCPGNSQGIFPVFFTGTPQFQVSVPSTSATVTRLYLLNIPMNGGFWGTSTAAVTLSPRGANGGPVANVGNGNSQSTMLAGGVGANGLALAANAPGMLQLDTVASLLTAPGVRTLIPLDVAIVTTGGTAVTALNAGNRKAGGKIQNPIGATPLGINEIGTASGTTSAGSTTFIAAGETYILQPSTLAVSVISADSAHAFSGFGMA